MEIIINITQEAKELIKKNKNQDIGKTEIFLTPEEYDKLIEILKENNTTLEKYIEDFLVWCIHNPEELKKWLEGEISDV